jgi:hypothetical protein
VRHVSCCRGDRMPGSVSSPQADRLLFSAATLVLTLARTLSAAGPTPDEKCLSTKDKAVGNLLQKRLVCEARGLATEAGTNPTCVVAAELGFAGSFQKAEARGGCHVVGEAGAVDTMVRSSVQNVVDALPGGATSASRRCAAVKRVAAGVLAQGTLRCLAQGDGRGLPPAARCLYGARQRFAAGFAAAELLPMCADRMSAGDIEAKIDGGVEGVVGILSGRTSTTTNSSTTTLTGSTSTTTMPVAVSFLTDVQPILTASCTAPQCHISPNPASTLDLAAGVAYGQLVNVPSAQKPTLLRVLPGNPGKSYMYQKITNARGIVGTPMPNVGPALSAAELAMVNQWISAGAPNN